MTSSDIFNKEFNPNYGLAVDVAPNVQRITCNNSGPFTYKGTNTYIVGKDALAIIDPGPLDANHLNTIIHAIDQRPVSHIFISHTHMDHSPLARELQSKTGAKIVGAAPHFLSRDLHLGEINQLDAAADYDYAPDAVLSDTDLVDGDGWCLEAVATPGHTANHLAFALKGTDILFSADHVMAWATTIVAPPDGSMRDYMASLDKLLERDEALYFPGHGGAIRNPSSFLRGLKAHRKMRERAVLDRIQKGDQTIQQMVLEIYKDTDPRLHGAAGLSVFAHLEDLLLQKRVVCNGTPSLDALYFLPS